MTCLGRIMFKHDCQKHGHKYEARYDCSAAVIGDLAGLKTSVDAALQAIEKTRSKTYVRDICTHCGHTIEREKAV